MAYSEYWGNLVFHRLDRITNMKISHKKATPIRSVPGYEGELTIRDFLNMPYMYTDKPELIEFIADVRIVDQIIDWFGTGVKFTKTGDATK